MLKKLAIYGGATVHDGNWPTGPRALTTLDVMSMPCWGATDGPSVGNTVGSRLGKSASVRRLPFTLAPGIACRLRRAPPA